MRVELENLLCLIRKNGVTSGGTMIPRDDDPGGTMESKNCRRLKRLEGRGGWIPGYRLIYRLDDRRPVDLDHVPAVGAGM